MELTKLQRAIRAQIRRDLAYVRNCVISRHVPITFEPVRDYTPAEQRKLDTLYKQRDAIHKKIDAVTRKRDKLRRARRDKWFTVNREVYNVVRTIEWLCARGEVNEAERQLDALKEKYPGLI